MDRITAPIGKDIAATAVLTDSKKNIRLYPKPQRLPNLYEHLPYVIYGKTESLEDFHIFLQGKYYDRWLDIKQLVIFNKEKEVPYTDLAKEWTIQCAYDHYDRFLQDGKGIHLVHAKRLLSPYRIPVAFR